VSVLQELLAAIEADPGDEAPQLVIADHLQAAGDPRGDLIVLDHAERRGLLTEPAAFEQLLLLAAEYSFPHAGPDAPPLDWDTSEPERYVMTYREAIYAVRRGDESHWELEVDRPEGDGFIALLPEVGTSALDERILEILGRSRGSCARSMASRSRNTTAGHCAATGSRSSS
jgi:uncharacterized protein (TIGR02996 family)